MNRILHIIPGLTGGGAEHQLTILASVEARRGHSVHIAMLRPETPKHVIEAGVHLHHWSSSGNYDPLMFFRLREIAHRIKPDIVQTWLVLPDVIGGAVARTTNVPWILSERSEKAAYPPSWKHNARIRLGRKSQAIIANSEGGASYWTSHGVPSDRISIIPNAVVIDEGVSTQPPELPPEFRDRPLVLFAGRLSIEKNPLVLIDALTHAFEHTNAVALLCGTGSMQAEMIERIAMCGMTDRIVLAGHRKDIPALMRVASLCVAISTFEGNPNVVLEAMAARCPLVVSDTAGYTRLLDNTSARIVPADDVTAIASAIVNVLDDTTSASARASRAHERLVNRTPDDLANAHENVYSRVV